MVKWKTKAIQTEFGTFRHNQSYSDIIQAYSSIFKTLCNHGICRTVVYLKPCHIHSAGIFRTAYIQNTRIFLNSGAGYWFAIFASTIDAFSCFRVLMCLYDMLSSILFLEWSAWSFKCFNRVFFHSIYVFLESAH